MDFSIRIATSNERQVFGSVDNAHYLEFFAFDFIKFNSSAFRHVYNIHAKFEIFWQELPYTIMDRGRVSKTLETDRRYRTVFTLFHTNNHDAAARISKAEYVLCNLLVFWPLSLIVQMVRLTDPAFQ